MILLVLGGARSGKSCFAEQIALSMGDVTYIATAEPNDPEMTRRIELHKERRPSEWRTWEGDVSLLPSVVAELGGTLLLDCLTLYLTRLFLADPASESEDENAWQEAESRILASVAEIFERFADAHGGDGCSNLIVVSNEIGLGLVPPYLMGRRFRDMQGRANRTAAGCADSVALMVAGLPLWLKGSDPSGVHRKAEVNL